MKWRRITVSSDPDEEEIVSNILLESGAQGVAINGGWQADVTPNGWDWAGDLPAIPYSVDAYYDADKPGDLKEQIRSRLEAALDTVPDVAVTTVDDTDWRDNWKRYFKPLRAADRIVIKPTWTAYDSYADDIVVEIDPGMAFGTGGHETTRMCLRMLEQYVYGGNTVIDVGSGSGVLSIAAAKLGADSVYALEADPTAVRVARENVEGNGVPEQVTVIESDLLGNLPQGIKSDLVVSNIIADVIIRLVPEIGNVLKPNGMFVCSGIIEDRLADVVGALQKHGLRIISIERDGEWCAVACKNKG